MSHFISILFCAYLKLHCCFLFVAFIKVWSLPLTPRVHSRFPNEEFWKPPTVFLPSIGMTCCLSSGRHFPLLSWGITLGMRCCPEGLLKLLGKRNSLLPAAAKLRACRIGQAFLLLFLPTSTKSTFEGARTWWTRTQRWRDSCEDITWSDRNHSCLIHIYPMDTWVRWIKISLIFFLVLSMKVLSLKTRTYCISCSIYGNQYPVSPPSRNLMQFACCFFPHYFWLHFVLPGTAI